jgi:hypothetical protein
VGRGRRGHAGGRRFPCSTQWLVTQSMARRTGSYRSVFQCGRPSRTSSAPVGMSCRTRYSDASRSYFRPIGCFKSGGVSQWNAVSSIRRCQRMLRLQRVRGPGSYNSRTGTPALLPGSECKTANCWRIEPKERSGTTGWSLTLFAPTPTTRLLRLIRKNSKKH